MIEIRRERPEDKPGVREVNERAFGQPEEANLVDALRENFKAVLSLVAVDGHRVIGHILFSPVAIEGDGESVAAIGLAPMSVLPEFQRRGIGSRLVETGLSELKKSGHEIVIVLGHPEYYPRFGFAPASRYKIKSEYDVRDEVFMAMEMREGALANCAGIAKYQPEFNEVK